MDQFGGSVCHWVPVSWVVCQWVNVCVSECGCVSVGGSVSVSLGDKSWFYMSVLGSLSVGVSVSGSVSQGWSVSVGV